MTATEPGAPPARAAAARRDPPGHARPADADADPDRDDGAAPLRAAVPKSPAGGRRPDAGADVATAPGAAADRAHEPARVAVLLALCQGARHLEAQLDSIAAQTGAAPEVVVSDDGSTDDGPAIARAHGARMLDGPRRGAAANFLHLLREAAGHAPFASFCDQDDVWLPDKTARALEALARVPEGVPAVHCGRTTICDAQGRALRPSLLHARPPSFRNALVQSLAGGNTMTLNRAAIGLLAAASREPAEIVVHDWWIYQIVSGAGGVMIYDPEPLLLYRQHGANAIGENTTARALARRAAMVAGGRFRAWSEVNVAALEASRHRLTPQARETLDGFAALRRAALPGRLAALRRLGLYRQTRVGDAALRAAVALGRI